MNLKIKHLLIIVLFFSTTINAQNLKSIYKNIVKEDYKDVQAEYNKGNNEFNKEEKILVELSKCILYSKSKYQSFKPREAFNIYKSLSIINLSQNEQTNINEFLSKYTYTITGIYDTIIKGVYLESKTLNTIESYEEAIQICNDCKYKIELLNLKEVTAYKQALNYGNVEVLEQFLINYPSSKLKDEIEGLLHTKAFERATLINTVTSMNEYIERYTKSKLISNAYRFRDSLVLKSTNKTHKDYLAFNQDYPNSFFNSTIATQLPDLLFNEISVDNDYYKMLEFVKKYPRDTRVESVQSRIKSMKYYEISVNKINNWPIENHHYRFRYNKKNQLVEINQKYIDTCGLIKFDNIVSGDYSRNKFDLASKNGKWGIIDSTGKERTQFKYDELNFDNGFIKAKSNNKWGLIDSNGKEIIRIIYDEIKLFADGYAIVKIIEDFKQTSNLSDISSNSIKWELIDMSEKLLFPIKYEKIDYPFYEEYIKLFKDNFAIFQINNKYGLINKAGKEIIPFKYDNINSQNFGMFLADLNNKNYLFDSTGNIISSQIPNFNGILNNKLIIVEQNRKYGIKDFYGNEILSINYDEIRVLNFNLISFKKDNKYGLINSNGKLVCPLKYEEINEFDKNRAIVGVNMRYFDEGYTKGEYGLIDEFGNQLSDLKFSVINSFNNGYAHVVDLMGNSMYIDANCNVIKPFPYNIYDEVYSYIDDCAVVKKNNKYGLIDSLGNLLTQLKYDYIDGTGSEYNTYFRTVQINGKLGVINNKGQELTKIKYDDVDFQNQNYLKLRFNGKWTLIDVNGIELTSIKYDDISVLDSGKIIAKKQQKWGLIGLNGVELTQFKYDEISILNNLNFRARIGDKELILNLKGKELTPFIKCDKIESFENNIISASLGNKYALINIDGKPLTLFKYDYINIEENIVIVKINNKKGLVNFKGKELTLIHYNKIKIKNDGFMVTVKDEKIGFINRNGLELCSNKFDDVSEFSEKYIITRFNGKRGVIDMNGKEVLPFKYREIEFLSNDIFIVSENGEIKIIKLFNN